MLSHIVENAGQSPHLQRIMIRHGDVVFSVTMGR